MFVTHLDTSQKCINNEKIMLLIICVYMDKIKYIESMKEMKQWLVWVLQHLNPPMIILKHTPD